MTFHNRIFVVLSYEVVWPRRPRHPRKELGEYFQHYIFEISRFHWSKCTVECAIYSILILKSAQARCARCTWLSGSLLGWITIEFFQRISRILQSWKSQILAKPARIANWQYLLVLDTIHKALKNWVNQNCLYLNLSDEWKLEFLF